MARGTKVTTELPEPNGTNMHSFHKLFVITNSNNTGDQLPVGEAAPFFSCPLLPVKDMMHR